MVMVGCAQPVSSSASNVLSTSRPQLPFSQATSHSAKAYLAQGPTPWQPVPVDARNWVADFTVAADGSGTHLSVQAAVDAVPALAPVGQAQRRWLIHIRPGVYRGPLCVRDKAPLALYGTPGAKGEAGASTLVDSRYNALPKRAGVDAAQPCQPNWAAATHGTSGSATAVIASPDVVLEHLRVANDAFERAGATALAPGAQAVALMTQADRVQLHDVQLSSYQDTFYVKRPTPAEPARVFVRGSLIEGDVDFVFGNATLVIDDSTLVSRAGRLGAERGGYVLAPSTPTGAALGFLVQRSRFVAELGLKPGRTALGRAWDEGVPAGQWRAGVSPNGQALVRDSALGPHVAGCAASTSRRPFTPSMASSPMPEANRLIEFANTAAPADLARETLAPDDGWASADGGTRGGADAHFADVHTVRNRAQLAAALVPHGRPRIVQVQGRIDLSEDAQGRPLGEADYRHPAFNWAAFSVAYDPATWGRRPPEGPLEEARRASARAQAAQVTVAVPSRTTVIGMGTGAQLVNGGLVLDGVRDVIIRNLRISDAYDHFPAWEPNDNQHGEWNSEYDNLTLRRSSHVWIDHCTLDDGDGLDGAAGAESPEQQKGTGRDQDVKRRNSAPPTLFGRPMQRHDGLLDITRGSDRITVSWNHFRQHGKTSLVGGSDRHTEDEGRLRVSFRHNLWEQTQERSPRVRYGRVHLVNNLYRANADAELLYSVGVGHRAAVLSQANAWELATGVLAQRLVRLMGNGALRDEGSLLNGQPVDLPGLLRALAPAQPAPPSVSTFVPDWNWTPPSFAPPDKASEVPDRVRAGAGAGRLWTRAPIPH